MRFLIFEDHADTATFYRRALTGMFGREAHFDLRIVSSIEEGFRELENYPARTIFLDLKLPPYGPENVIARIPELAARADVIVASENVEPPYFEQAILAGANDFIPKSILFDNSTQDGRLGIQRLVSRIGASYYRSKRDHGH